MLKQKGSTKFLQTLALFRQSMFSTLLKLLLCVLALLPQGKKWKGDFNTWHSRVSRIIWENSENMKRKHGEDGMVLRHVPPHFWKGPGSRNPFT